MHRPARGNKNPSNNNKNPTTNWEGPINNHNNTTPNCRRGPKVRFAGPLGLWGLNTGNKAQGVKQGKVRLRSSNGYKVTGWVWVITIRSNNQLNYGITRSGHEYVWLTVHQCPVHSQVLPSRSSGNWVHYNKVIIIHTNTTLGPRQVKVIPQMSCPRPKQYCSPMGKAGI